MKTKISKKPTSIHVRVERFFRHRTSLGLVLSIMALGCIKYQDHLAAVVHEIYTGQGNDVLSVSSHHQEITRMPVSYGGSVKLTPISGE